MEHISQTLKQFSSPGNIPGQMPYEGLDEPEESAETKKENLRKALNLTSWDNTFANFRLMKGTQASLRAFKEIAAGASWHMLLVYGGTGSGKTHLCEALSIELIKRSIRAPVVEWPSVIRYIKSSFDSEVKGESKLIFKRYCEMSWLILDDVGMGGSGSAWEWGEFDEIINARFRDGLPTVVTTNLDITKLPDRAVSRFRDAIKGRVVLNEGADYRPKRVPSKPR